MKEIKLPKKQHVEKRKGYDLHISDDFMSEGLMWIDFLYCENCFCNILNLSPADDKMPLEERSYHCVLCSNFGRIRDALKTLPPDVEMRQQKALNLKRIEDEQDELEDEIDDLEKQKENYK